MTKRIRKTFTQEERRRCWQLWRQGLGYSDIARAIASKPGTVFGLIRLNGGFAPPQRLRNQLHLTLLEREEISRGIAQGLTVRTIATQLERSPSTISRELNRNGGVDTYRATKADHKARKNAYRPKPCKLASNAELCEFITEKWKELDVYWWKVLDAVCHFTPPSKSAMPAAVVVKSVLDVAILFAPFLNLIQSTTKFSYTEI